MKHIRFPSYGLDDNGRFMQKGFSIFRFNDVFGWCGEHVMSFETYDRPALDDLIEFEAWLSQSDLLLRCAETRIVSLVRDNLPGEPGGRDHFPKRAYLRIEVSGILLDNQGL